MKRKKRTNVHQVLITGRSRLDILDRQNQTHHQQSILGDETDIIRQLAKAVPLRITRDVNEVGEEIIEDEEAIDAGVANIHGSIGWQQTLTLLYIANLLRIIGISVAWIRALVTWIVQYCNNDGIYIRCRRWHHRWWFVDRTESPTRRSSGSIHAKDQRCKCRRLLGSIFGFWYEDFGRRKHAGVSKVYGLRGCRTLPNNPKANECERWITTPVSFKSLCFWRRRRRGQTGHPCDTCASVGIHRCHRRRLYTSPGPCVPRVEVGMPRSWDKR